MGMAVIDISLTHNSLGTVKIQPDPRGRRVTRTTAAEAH